MINQIILLLNSQKSFKMQHGSVIGSLSLSGLVWSNNKSLCFNVLLNSKKIISLLQNSYPLCDDRCMFSSLVISYFVSPLETVQFKVKMSSLLGWFQNHYSVQLVRCNAHVVTSFNLVPHICTLFNVINKTHESRLATQRTGGMNICFTEACWSHEPYSNKLQLIREQDSNAMT